MSVNDLELMRCRLDREVEQARKEYERLVEQRDAVVIVLGTLTRRKPRCGRPKRAEGTIARAVADLIPSCPMRFTVRHVLDLWEDVYPHEDAIGLPAASQVLRRLALRGELGLKVHSLGSGRRATVYERTPSEGGAA